MNQRLDLYNFGVPIVLTRQDLIAFQFGYARSCFRCPYTKLAGDADTALVSLHRLPRMAQMRRSPGLPSVVLQGLSIILLEGARAKPCLFRGSLDLGRISEWVQRHMLVLLKELLVKFVVVAVYLWAHIVPQC